MIGQIPLPFENLKKSYAPGARTWQFAQPLIADGHDVVIMGIRIPFVYEDNWPEIVERKEGGCVIYSITPEEAERQIFLTDLANRFEPDCMLGVFYYPAYIACTSGLEVPIWADMYGCVMAEAQIKAAVYNDDSYLDHFLRMEHVVVSGGDRFSTVSLRQKYELIGELGILRRLNSNTVEHDFVVDIPTALPDIRIENEGALSLRERVSKNDFLVLWSGGYNTWTDVKTLLQGLEMAMDKNPNIKFVSTGGSIDGHDEITYPSFTSMVEKSKFRDRFLLEGWIDRELARSYYLACDIGINIDAKTYEVMFGSRTRILDWALAGLPTLSTNLCELTEELAEKDLLYTFEVGDPESLARSLMNLANNRSELKEVGKRIKHYVHERFSYENTTQALREWVKSPGHAPDYEGRKLLFTPPPAPKPPITPDSRSRDKLRYYLKTDGTGVTIKRAADYFFRKISRH